MKKTKIIVPAVALLALGLAASTTATVAWFQVSNASIGAGQAATGTVIAATSSSSLGSFTVTPLLDTAISGTSVVLSDKDGNVFTESGNVKVNVNSSNTIESTRVIASVKVRIDYTGSASSASEVASLWNAAAGDTFKFTITDTTAFTGTAPSAAIVSYYGGAGSSGIKGAAYGLKFKNSAPSRGEDGWKNENTAATHASNTLDTAEFSLDNQTFSAGSGAVNFTVTTGVVKQIYVGIVGIDGIEQSSDDSYSLSIGVSGGGINS